MRMRNVSALAVTTLCGITATASANILLNAGFETGTGADADDWGEITGGSAGFAGRSDLMPHSGSFSAYVAFDHINNPASGGAYFVEQTQPVGSINPLVDYDLSFYAKVDSTDFTGANAFVQILWLDQDASNGGGVQGEMLTSIVGLGVNTTYQQFTMNDLDVPDTADSFLLRFQLSAGAVDNIANGLYVDDASLTQVPAPTSAALLGLAGLAATRRRR